MMEEFERLMLDYLKGVITPEDGQKLVLWLKNEPSCRERYRELSRIYAVTSTSWFAAGQKENQEALHDRLNMHSSRKWQAVRRMKIGYNVAICILIIGFASFFFYQKDAPSSPSAASYCQIEIPLGAQSRLLLPDSTLVYLNGGTVLRYDASFQDKKQRSVFLTGEALFKVSRNVEKPFVVHAGELDIKVLGTTFNVSSYQEEPDIKVTLVEGKVNVSAASDMRSGLLLAPDEQAVYNKSRKQLSSKKIDADAEAAWATGRLVFVNETLRDLLKTVGKKYDVQILIQSGKAATEYFSGSIDTGLSLDEILSYIDVDQKYVWRKKGKTIVMTDR